MFKMQLFLGGFTKCILCEKFKDPRCNFYEHFNQNQHFNLNVKKASQKLNILRFLKSSVTRETLICVYNAFVPVWNMEEASSSFCWPDDDCLESLSARRLAAGVKFFDQRRNSTNVLPHRMPKQANICRFLLPATESTFRLISFFSFHAPLSEQHPHAIHFVLVSCTFLIASF